MEHYIQAFRQYVDFSGRWTRTQYWMFFLVNFLIILGIVVVESLLKIGFISSLYGLVLFIPSLAAAVRRLRDAGFSPWWILISLIPVIGTIALIVLLAQPTKAAAAE
ncbi:DUF805 domain-containing protein [Gilvimarinus agarilyticus]|uniref:DUF805 domain-containing protein n=1 Tax=Gilvimarinus agarilyticus TaxID=679259 RepID=UPI00059FBDB4|nr:DUF805 domain-containing protein [Gilvimarinus agarilyticus]